MPHPDWIRVSRDYVEGIDTPDGITYPSLRALAEHHGLNDSNIRRRSAAENWPAQRRAHRDTLEQARTEALIDTVTTEGVTFDRTALDLATRSLALIAEELDNLTPDDDRPATISTLGLAAKRWYELGSEAMGRVPQLDLNVGGEVAVDVQTREQRIEHVGLVLGALVDAGAVEGLALTEGQG